jgi:DNA repair protein RecN (Recombination protein N)
MKQLAEQLVDIHSQHQTLMLNRPGFQLSVVDVFAGSESVLAEYQLAYKRLQHLQDELTDLREREAQAGKESDYFRFLFSELEEVRLEPDSLQKMESEATALEHAETIRNVLLQTSETLDADGGIVSSIAGVRQSIAAIAKFGEKYAGLGERMQSIYIELKELASDLHSAGERLVVDDKRLNELNEWIDRFNRLMKKHGVADEAALMRAKEELEEKLAGYESLETRISEAEKEQKLARANVMTIGERLSQLRTKAAPALEREVKKILGSMGMEHAILRVVCQSLTEPGPAGLDDIKFVFTANKGATPSELQKVASGGELSRLMLALKSILAQRKNLPCVIFDEIDTGVSGEIADKIGNILLHMGQRMQVIAITHLPQLASKGKHHLFVYKKDGKNETVSYIRPLDAVERITEVAKMLSRGKPSESAISNAKELLGQ